MKNKEKYILGLKEKVEKQRKEIWKRIDLQTNKYPVSRNTMK